MTIDVGAFLRLKSAIDSTLSTLKIDPTSAVALSKAYATFQSAGQTLAQDNELGDEFIMLFPPGSVASGSSAAHNMVRELGRANEAAAGLAGISGWIEGIQQGIQAKANAEAYAQHRLQHETGRSS